MMEMQEMAARAWSRWRWFPKLGEGRDGCLSRMENALNGAHAGEGSHSRNRCRWVSEAGAEWSMRWEEEIAMRLAWD